MSAKFEKLTKANVRKLNFCEKIIEQGIIFERLSNGNGRYSVNIMVDGQRIHRVIGTEKDGTTRQNAEDFIQKVRVEAKQGRLNLPKGRKISLGFKRATDQYLSKLEQQGGKDISKKKQRLTTHLVPFFNDKPLSNITGFDVERYKKNRLESNAKAGTINRELAILSHLLNKAVEWGWIDSRKCNFKRLKEDKGRITYLTNEQIKLLIAAAEEDQSPQVLLFITIGLETSMRRSEILSIQIENIDLDKRVIYIPNAKAGPREQPITRYLCEVLKNNLNYLNGEFWLFPSKNSSLGHTINIEKSFRRVVERAGLDPKLIVRHTLRHTAITHLVQAGVDLPTVQRISGHKSLQMVARYSHQNGEHIRLAMDTLEQRYKLKDMA